MKSSRTIIFVLAIVLVIVLLVLAPRMQRAADRTAALKQLPVAFESTKLVTLDAGDHTRGAEKPLVTIVEYSDLDCPFCHKSHPLVQRVVKNNPDTVAWVYRQMPLVGLHPDAMNKSKVTECIATIKGNDAFWTAVDSYMKEVPTATVLADAGLTESDIVKCADTAPIKKAIADDIKSAEAINIQGTPYFVLVGANGQQFAIPGMPQGMLLDVAVEKMLEANK